MKFTVMIAPGKPVQISLFQAYLFCYLGWVS